MSLLYEENNDKILDRNTTMMFNVDTNKRIFSPRPCVEKYEEHCELEQKNRVLNKNTKKEFLNVDIESDLFIKNKKNNYNTTISNTTLNPEETKLDVQFAPPDNISFKLYESSKRLFRFPAKYGTKK